MGVRRHRRGPRGVGWDCRAGEHHPASPGFTASRCAGTCGRETRSGYIAHLTMTGADTSGHAAPSNEDTQRADCTSVFAKSFPTYSSGHLRLAPTRRQNSRPGSGRPGGRPCPIGCRHSAARTASASISGITSIPAPVMRRSISAASPFRAATISGSAKVAAEIKMAVSTAMASAQAGPRASPAAMANNADVSTTIKPAAPVRHAGNPGCVPHPHRAAFVRPLCMMSANRARFSAVLGMCRTGVRRVTGCPCRVSTMSSPASARRMLRPKHTLSAGKTLREKGAIASRRFPVYYLTVFRPSFLL